jgi:murein DD-endopeptidase MepM/ murein hydrolase activator NlpD
MATTTVKKGDSLSKIAAKAGISLSALIKLNPQIKNPSLIKPGQVVTISKPAPAKPTPPKTSVPSPAGGNDAQNAARLIAEQKTYAPIITDITQLAKQEAFSPAGMRAELDRINAEQDSPEVFGETVDAVEDTNDGIPDEGAIDVPDDGANNAPARYGAAIEPAGDYTFDVKTGILLFNGKPYTGTYNGFEYVSGNKKDATVGKIIDKNFDPLDLEGPTDAELARLDAFEQLKGLFETYNLGSLAGKITEYMKAGKGPNETVLLLKKSDEYNLRFQGNTLRLAAGLNVMSEDAYLQLEDSYAETLTRYGLRGMLSTDRTKNEAMFAKYMGNDLAAPEFKSRIELVTDRVMNADPATKETFKKFFPNITDADLVSYFLSPKDTLSKLQEKATTAEIGSAALSQDLTTSLTSATDLAKFGVDRAAAIQGYAAIKEVLPTSQKLGSIYDEAGIKYDQASGEAEFLKLNEDARLKRKRLESLERGSFSGSAGIAASALRKSSTAGQV